MSTISTPTPAPSILDRTIRVRTSKDGGYVFGDWRTQSLGDTGVFLQPHVFRRFGQARHWTLELSVISAAPVVVMGASVQVEPYAP